MGIRILKKMTKTELLKRFMNDIWNNQQIEKVSDYVHSAYTVHLDTADPWEGKTLNHSQFIERLHFSFGSFPDIHFNITSAIEDENHVAITWILTGTNTGKLGEMPATNKCIETNGMTIYHFTNGKISGHTQVFDRMAVARQLGFV